MNYSRHFIATLTVLILTLTTITQLARAQDDGLVEDVDYQLITPAQPTRAPEDKIEVLEFFNFSCPHCFRLLGPMKLWKKNNDLSDVEIIHQPVIFNRSKGHYARIFHVLESLTIEDEYYDKVFYAIHEEKKLINSKSRFAEWLEEYNFPEDKTASIYDSFLVNSQIKRDARVVENYGITSTPQLVIAGKYLLSPSTSGSIGKMLEIATLLIERERKANL